ncbi:MAG: MerR family transcriptional regulator, partial [Xanthomonadales bacterium]|nr:MerR family transcriptional regulator [Xanthomonadales bacterium]
YHHQARGNTGPRILIAGLPREHHEIGLLLFALAAMESGYRVLSLGANMVLEELWEIARKTDSRAIVLSGAIEPGKQVLGKDLPALVEQSQVPVLVGGLSSVYSCDAINRAGAEALGRDIEHGMQRLSEILSSK